MSTTEISVHYAPGAIPVGALGTDGAYSHAMSGAVPATWSTAEWVPTALDDRCELKTRKGDPCQGPKAQGTNACAGHLNAIAAWERAVAAAAAAPAPTE